MEIREKIEELERQLNELKASIEEVKDYRPITERVKTFRDAVEILGEEHPFVKQLDNVANTILADKYSPDVVAYLKLRIITAALNEGWEPQFTEDEYRYFPWFRLYMQEEWNKLDEEAKKSGVLFVGGAYRVANSGFAYLGTDGAPSDACTNLGSRLCFRTRELAQYAGLQFAKLYADFYLIRK